jgi:hypothetical protein
MRSQHGFFSFFLSKISGVTFSKILVKILSTSGSSFGQTSPSFAGFPGGNRSHDAVIRVYDAAGNVIETHEQGTNLNKFRHQRKAKDNVVPLRSDQVVSSFTHVVS